MSSEIISFLKNLKDWRKNFSIHDYDYSQYNCEIADIAKMQIEKNADGLIKFWNTKVKNEYFEIKHPIYNDVTLRAVHSVYNNFLHNCVFFIDKDNKHILLWVQFSHLINCFLVQDKFFRILEPWGDNATLSAMDLFKNYLNNVVVENLLFKDTNWGFTLSHARPFHFFMDILPSFYKIDNERPVVKNALFCPKNIQYDNADVTFFPATIALDEKLINNMQLNVYKDSLEKHFTIDEPSMKYDLLIWLGLPGEKRSWIEQIDGIANIIKQLFLFFPKIKIYFDGMTANDSIKDVFVDNYTLYVKVKEKISQLNNNNNNCDIISLIGYDYRTKIYYCSKVDFAISDIGTTSLVPFEFCQVPGVGIYGSLQVKWLLDRFKNKNNFFVYIENKYTMKSFDSKDLKDKMSYHIPWQHVYNMVVDCLYQIKSIKIPKLKVQDVKILEMYYKIDKIFNIELSPNEIVLLYFLEDKMKIVENFIETNLTKYTKLEQGDEKLNGYIDNIELKIKNIEEKNNLLLFQIKYGTAKTRIQNQLSYKLGQAMIINSKSLLGYIKMPFVLFYIKDKHNQEQKIYQEKIKKDPSLRLPPLEEYPDYKEALKEKECLTYKLGQALIKANKTWYGGGYIKLLFEIRKLKGV